VRTNGPAAATDMAGAAHYGFPSGHTDESRHASEGGGLSSALVLTERLSNRDLTTLYQRLMARDWKQAERRHRLADDVAPDGRRKFGTVRDAIVVVLENADRELRVRDIHEAVETLLGESVPRSSVKSHLRRGCVRRNPLFEYRGSRGYLLSR
jgi:hypothetical protein